MSGLSWLAGFLSVLTLRRVWLWFQKIFTKQKLSSTDSIDTTEKRSLTDDQSERVTRFEDLPDELMLAICRYLSPPHVLNAFLDCNSRMFRCIFDYHTHINLTNWSYTDLQSIRGLIDSKRLVPIRIDTEQFDVFATNRMFILFKLFIEIIMFRTCPSTFNSRLYKVHYIVVTSNSC